MIDAKAYYNQCMAKTVPQLENDICHITGGEAEGVAADYNTAVSGGDVKDNIFRLAILHLALFSKVNADIDEIAGISSILDVVAGDAKFSGDVIANGAETFHYRRTLTDSDDLNTIVTPGVYYYASTNRPAHAPSVYASVLLIFSSASKSLTTQIALNNNDAFLFRTKLPQDDEWAAWKAVAKNDTVDGLDSRISAVEYQLADMVKYRGQLTASNDLNETVNCGFYFYVGSNTPAHKPSAYSSIVFVYALPSRTGSQFVAQVAYNSLGNMYWRASQNGASWTEWAVGATKADIHTIEDRLDIIESQHLSPNSEKLAAAYKRAHKMADFEWTALSSIPSVTDHSGISAGSWIGIPYTSAKENNGYVPTSVSFRTFASALKNPYSLIYTEDTASRESTPTGVSGYGFEYNGTNCGSYFGTVCSQFVCYVLGLPIMWDTVRIPWLAKQGVFQVVSEPTEIKLMDVVWKSGHCAIISDIDVDYTGAIHTVYVTESLPGLQHVRNKIVVPNTEPYDLPTKGTRTTAYTMAEFIAQQITADNGVIYRYNDLYLPSASGLSNMMNDADIGSVDNNDICTYAGDYASFSVEFPIHINYKKGAYTDIVIKRERNIVDTVSLPAEYNSTHSIDITAYCSTAGRYTAYLTDGNNNSAPTHFEIVDTSVEFDGTMDALTVTFNKNANPIAVSVIGENGAPKCIKQLTVEDLTSGSVTFNATQLTIDQIGVTPTGTNYVRVEYQGQYGTVVNGKYLIS